MLRCLSGDSCPVQFVFLSFSAFFRSLDTPLWAVLSEKIPRRWAEPALPLDRSSASRLDIGAGEGKGNHQEPDCGRRRYGRLAVSATTTRIRRTSPGADRVVSRLLLSERF